MAGGGSPAGAPARGGRGRQGEVTSTVGWRREAAPAIGSRRQRAQAHGRTMNWIPAPANGGSGGCRRVRGSRGVGPWGGRGGAAAPAVGGAALVLQELGPELCSFSGDGGCTAGPGGDGNQRRRHGEDGGGQNRRRRQGARSTEPVRMGSGSARTRRRRRRRLPARQAATATHGVGCGGAWGTGGGRQHAPGGGDGDSLSPRACTAGCSQTAAATHRAAGRCGDVPGKRPRQRRTLLRSTHTRGRWSSGVSATATTREKKKREE